MHPSASAPIEIVRIVVGAVGTLSCYQSSPVHHDAPVPIYPALVTYFGDSGIEHKILLDSLIQLTVFLQFFQNAVQFLEFTLQEFRRHVQFIFLINACFVHKHIA